MELPKKNNNLNMELFRITLRNYWRKNLIMKLLIKTTDYRTDNDLLEIIIEDQL